MIAPLAAALERETPPLDGLAGWLEGSMPWLHTMKGPDFLVLFAVWFLVIRIGLACARSSEMVPPFATLAALVLFEGLGVLRWIAGSAHGMRKWEFMGVMMFIGGVLMLLHFDRTDWSSGGSNCSSSCSGSSGCGGGSSGGGGCGGCGGGGD